MDTVPYPHHIPRKPVASSLFVHQDGGIARDIYVSEEGFRRFFDDMSDGQFGRAKSGYNPYVEVYGGWTKCLGIVEDGGTKFRIRIIEHSHSRVGQLLGYAPYLWPEEGDHGIRASIPNSQN